jgi:serine/alanine adding enzyme
VQVRTFSGSAGEWDAFVRQQTNWSHFHLHGWKSAIERVFGHECLYLAAYDEGTLAGVLPLVRVRSLAFGHYLVSMPFVNYGGPLGTAAAISALVDEATRIAQSERVKLLELRSRVPLPLATPVSHRKITVVLDLGLSSSALWKGLDSKLRSQVRRPQKEGVTVCFGLDQVAPFFSVFSRHMRDLGTPTLPSSFFRTIAQLFAEDVLFGCAYLNGKPVAAGCGFRWQDEFEMTWASSLQEYKRVAPNMLLYWSFIERMADEGLQLFNFGRCTPGGGTHRFKSQWGARDELLWWYQPLAASGTAGTPSPTDKGIAWGPALWKRLPTRVATALGPKIVRYIP